MKPTECSILTYTQQGPCQITDVGQFFSEITVAYLRLQESILYLDKNIPTYSPEQILDGCEKIRQKQNNIAILDQQLIDIITLAGTEISQEPFVHNYRVAFARANMACNDLYQNLKALRGTLQEKITPISIQSYF